MGKRLVALGLVLVLAFGGFAALTGCKPGIESNIISISTQGQTSNGIDVTNYQIKVKNDLGWDTLSADDKQALVNAAMNQCFAKIKENGVRNYNIICISEAGTQLFLYDREHDQAIIYTGGGPTSTLPTPKSE
ncbi:MAG: hypothetical protein FWF71_01905 [Actinomycetia bacterium]|nr:hypothetical protein [Actinomycetes bacterium]